jgi:hypothetical protein
MNREDGPVQGTPLDPPGVPAQPLPWPGMVASVVVLGIWAWATVFSEPLSEWLRIQVDEAEQRFGWDLLPGHPDRHDTNAEEDE